MATMTRPGELELTVHLKRPHPKQGEFIYDSVKRKIVRAGRRSGKTTGVAIYAVEEFLKGHRILYANKTQEQVDVFWRECKAALKDPIAEGVFYKNETKHLIEEPGTERRIRAKTAWNADTLRGDYADRLILDEFQLMSADTLELVAYPMLIDNDGDLVLIYTSKRGKHHSKEVFAKAEKDKSGRWRTYTFTSHDNPHVSKDALRELSKDMTKQAYQAEIMAEEMEDDPRAIWERKDIEPYRISTLTDPEVQLVRVVIGVDPPGGAVECGIVACGLGDNGHGYLLGDKSLKASPGVWGLEAVKAYTYNQADRIVGEKNYGGDMVENTIRSVEGGDKVSYKDVTATRGKQVRAEPIKAFYERGLIHHVGEYTELEDEMCNWVPGESDWSPNRLDAMVWGFTELMLGGAITSTDNPFYD